MTEHSDTTEKLVSVIIPVYNADRYIADSVRSVIGQNYTNWELIVVDDGSTDATAGVVAQFLSDQRITYVKKENGGVSNARNHGAELASGSYFCFLDADDFFHADNLSEKVKLLNEDPETGLVHSDVCMTDEQGVPNGEHSTGLSGNDLHLAILLWDECVIPAPSSIMVRREVFYDAGKWDPAFSTAADQDLFIRVTHKYKIHRIKKILTSYRMVNSSMSNDPHLFESDHLGVYAKAAKNNLFPGTAFKRKCFSNLHLIIAATWWRKNKNGLRTLKHLIGSFACYPNAIFKRLKIKLSPGTQPKSTVLQSS